MNSPLWKNILIFPFTERCYAMFVIWLVLLQKASVRLTINMVLLEGLIGWEIRGWWPLTLKHRKKGERWSERPQSLFHTPSQIQCLVWGVSTRVRSVFCPWETWSTEKVDKKRQGGKWSEIGAKGRIPMSAEMNKIEIGGRRLAERKEGRRVKKGAWPKVQPQTRHKSKMVWKHDTFGLSVLVSKRGAKLFSTEALLLLSLDVLIVLISCCCSSITQKSQINRCVNINQVAESRRAGNSFREKEGIHSLTEFDKQDKWSKSLTFRSVSKEVHKEYEELTKYLQGVRHTFGHAICKLHKHI